MQTVQKMNKILSVLQNVEVLLRGICSLCDVHKKTVSMYLFNANTFCCYLSLLVNSVRESQSSTPGSKISLSICKSTICDPAPLNEALWGGIESEKGISLQ